MKNGQKEQRQFIKELRKMGCTVEPAAKNHYRVTTPNGRTVFIPSTPSDWRSIRNDRADVKRAMEART